MPLIINRDLLRLHEALNSLDGVREGKDNLIQFDFKMSVSWALTVNATLVEQAKVAFDRQVRKLAKDCGITPGETITRGEAVSPDKAARFQRLNDAIEELKDEQTEVNGLVQLRLEDILFRPASGDRKEGINPLPQSVRNGLVPIIKQG